MSLVITRSCEDCMMCCKLPAIRELAKPTYTWCIHASLALVVYVMTLALMNAENLIVSG